MDFTVVVLREETFFHAFKSINFSSFPYLLISQLRLHLLTLNDDFMTVKMKLAKWYFSVNESLSALKGL